ALNRLLTAGSCASQKLVQLFWEAGPQRTQGAMQQLLRHEVDAGQLAIEDIPRAASQFFVLLKGDCHAKLLCGRCEAASEVDITAHVRATVEFFLRAYASKPERRIPL